MGESTSAKVGMKRSEGSNIRRKGRSEVWNKFTRRRLDDLDHQSVNGRRRCGKRSCEEGL